MGEPAETTDAGGATDTDERLRAIEAHLKSISRWVTWLGYLSVFAVLVAVINWITALTA